MILPHSAKHVSMLHTQADFYQERSSVSLIPNSGTDRVIDVLRESISADSEIDAASPAFSLFAYGEIKDLLKDPKATRLLIPDTSKCDLNLLGSPSERQYRNKLQARWLAKRCIEWVSKSVRSGKLRLNFHNLRWLSEATIRIETGQFWQLPCDHTRTWPHSWRRNKSHPVC